MPASFFNLAGSTITLGLKGIITRFDNVSCTELNNGSAKPATPPPMINVLISSRLLTEARAAPR
jgi:hypothetical protein